MRLQWVNVYHQEVVETFSAPKSFGTTGKMMSSIQIRFCILGQVLGLKNMTQVVQLSRNLEDEI